MATSVRSGRHRPTPKMNGPHRPPQVFLPRDPYIGSQTPVSLLIINMYRAELIYHHLSELNVSSPSAAPSVSALPSGTAVCTTIIWIPLLTAETKASFSFPRYEYDSSCSSFCWLLWSYFAPHTPKALLIDFDSPGQALPQVLPRFFPLPPKSS